MGLKAVETNTRDRRRLPEDLMRERIMLESKLGKANRDFQHSMRATDEACDVRAHNGPLANALNYYDSPNPRSCMDVRMR